MITCGTISVALGVLGLFLPLLPTTPFLLLAAACYARSSEKLYHWLLGNRWFGQYIRNYREGKGIPLKRAAVAIALLWLTIGYTAVVAVSLWWVRLILLAIAGGVTVHLVHRNGSSVTYSLLMRRPQVGCVRTCAARAARDRGA